MASDDTAREDTADKRAHGREDTDDLRRRRAADGADGDGCDTAGDGDTSSQADGGTAGRAGGRGANVQTATKRAADGAGGSGCTAPTDAVPTARAVGGDSSPQTAGGTAGRAVGRGASDQTAAKATPTQRRHARRLRRGLLKTSDKGYKVNKESLNREEKITREVQSLLNKVAPDNLDSICLKLAEIELYNAVELENVIRIIFNKALLEPHYCETYANMAHNLKNKYPEFPPESAGEKPQTFTHVLLNTCQNEFEKVPTTIEPTAEEIAKTTRQELDQETTRRKQKMLANMKFIGHLFLRNVLAGKTIGQVVHDLIGVRGKLPEEHTIECVCELLQVIGHTLDGSTNGKDLTQKFATRLQELKRSECSRGQAAFSKRVQFLIQDVLDLRGNNWAKKLFKEQAATKEDISKQAMVETRKLAKGAGTVATFTTTVAGARPQNVNESSGSRPSGGGGRGRDDAAKVDWCTGYIKKHLEVEAPTRWRPALPAAVPAAGRCAGGRVAARAGPCAKALVAGCRLRPQAPASAPRTRRLAADRLS